MSNIADLLSFDHTIPLPKAIEMTRRYRDNRNLILKEEYKDSGILPICETLNNRSFTELMSQTGCVALRVYYGMNEKMEVKVVIVGVNAKDEDMIPSAAGRALDPVTGLVIDEAIRCPPTCPPRSSLNHP